MSYNTRRSGGFGGGPQQNVGNIGQRRPVVTNNFVPGGQLNQNKPGIQMPNQQQRPPQVQQQQQQQQHQQPQGNTNISFRTQQPPPNQGYQTAQQPPLPTQTLPAQTLPAQAPPQAQAKPEPQTPVKPVAAQVPGMNPPNPLLETSNGEQMDQDVTEDEATPRRKPFWANKTGNKITRKEKIRRRNVRLSKMLQPKNAVMILNELVKNTSYVVEDIAIKNDSNQFRASVLVDGVEHVGLGRSKIQAKNTAAENALKHLIKSNKLTEMKKDEEGNEKMDVSEDDSQAPLPWQHVASFALFKLFCSWGEDPNLVKGSAISNGSEKMQQENRPAKKMPNNPETMNPLMLINQMLPQAHFEEIGKSGNPPNVTYSYRCNVGEQSFIGTGPNKKAAKKLAAYGACNKVLNVTYPTDVYVPIY